MRYNDSFMSEAQAHFIGRNDMINRWGNAIASYQALPGLVGFWPLSSIQRSTGNAYDLSGQGRTLTYNGNPTINAFNLAPYIELDGTGDYLSRADETDLDILGAESWNGSPGLTMGCWGRVTAFPGSNAGMITKDNLVSNRSYNMFMTSAGLISGQVSNDGSTMVNAGGSAAVTTNTWFMAILRYVPSTSLSTIVDGVEVTNTTSIPASLFNGTAAFNVGAFSGSALFTGRIAFPFLCATALSDAIVNALYQQTRGLFGV